MNVDLPEMLATQAGAVDPPRIDPGDVIARGERLLERRRRRAATWAAGGLALVAAAIALALPGRTEDVAPAGPSDPSRTTGPGARPLGYALGRTLHLGPERIDLAIDVVSIDLVDEGAALATLDGTIWFTDGTDVVRVGQTRGRELGVHSFDADEGVPREWVVSDSSGSLLAWLDHPDEGGTPELVVWDARVRREVARQPIGSDTEGHRPKVLAVAGRKVFAAVGYTGRTLAPREMWSLDLADGSFVVVNESAYQQAIREVPRALVVGAAQLGNVLGTADGERGHLVNPDPIDVVDSRFRRVVDPGTGKLVTMVLPAGGPSTDQVWFGQWLDDDQFTVATNSAMWACQISAGRCRLLLEGAFLSDRDTAVLLPGDGSIGGDFALVRAEKAARADR